MNQVKTEYPASITVFLSMVIILILSVVLVSLESARVVAVKSSMSMALSRSMDSILAEYYLPLFEEYELFGYYEKASDESASWTGIESRLLESMEYVVNPTRGKFTWGKSYYHLLPARLTDLQLNHVKTLDDYETDAYYRQVVDAMSISVIPDIISEFLGKVKQISEVAEEGNTICVQADTIQEMGEFDELILEWMELMDGIEIREGLAVILGKSRLATKDMFVKKYVSNPGSMVDVKMNHNKVYESIKHQYQDKYILYNPCIELVDAIVAQLKEKNELQILYHDTMLEWDRITKNVEDMDEDKEKEIVQVLSELEDKIQLLSESISSSQHLLLGKLSDIQLDLHECKQILEKSRMKLDELIHMQKQMKEKLERNETKNTSNIEDEISVEGTIYDDLDKIKNYAAQSDSSNPYYNFTSMKETVEHNYKLLNEEITYISMNEIVEDISYYESIRNILTKNQFTMGQYSIEHLQLDYSNFNWNVEKDNSIIRSIRKFFQNGIIDLVLEDIDTISKNQLAVSSVPSTDWNISHSSIFEGKALNIVSTLKKLNLGNLLGGTMDELLDTERFMSQSKEMLSSVMFQLYLNNYFKDYTIEKEPSSATITLPSVLNYEKEYISFGADNDRDNLISMIYTLFLIRFVVNVVSVCRNVKCNELAYATALTLVSFTGMVALVMATKIIILIAWSFVETLVDVAILLKGEKLSIYQKNSTHVLYTELITVSKKMILDKASRYKSKSKLCMDYDDYVNIIVFLQSKDTKRYYSMDLIQANIDYRYEEGFRLRRCMSRFDVSCQYHIDPLFALGSMFRNGLQCSEKLEQSY